MITSAASTASDHGVALHPQILLNLNDHATRTALAAGGPPDNAGASRPLMMGVLLGRQQSVMNPQSPFSSTTELVTSYELPLTATHNSASSDPETLADSIDWVAAFLHATHLKEVLPELSVVGWYVVAPDDPLWRCPPSLLAAIAPRLQRYISAESKALLPPQPSLPLLYAVVMHRGAAAPPASQHWPLTVYAVGGAAEATHPVVVDCPVTLDAMEYIYVSTTTDTGDRGSTRAAPQQPLHHLRRCETVLQQFIGRHGRRAPLPGGHESATDPDADLLNQAEEVMAKLHHPTPPPAADPPLELLAALVTLQSRCAAQMYSLSGTHGNFMHHYSCDATTAATKP